MKSTRVLSALAIITAAGAPAIAGFTVINPPSGSEQSHFQIINTVYGGGFVPAGLGFTNGPISAIRAHDNNGAGGTIPGFLDVLNGSAAGGDDDQQWTDGVVSSESRAVFAGFSQSFGYFAGATGSIGGTNYIPLIDVVGNGYAVTGTNQQTFNSPFRFGRDNVAHDGVHRVSSLDTDNASDQMITYEITGVNGGRKTWLLFFADTVGGDYDYNDLVIELVVVPVPASVYGGMAGLGLLGTGMMARRRRLAR
ncbi:MAG: hypothetical protein H7Y88_13335 [Phycisphaerales bacterium]|nr:hypothetical protein [Phycisphaerales bacterium]